MADVTMCENGLRKNCPKYQECFRFMAEPNPQWQSYSNFIDICNEENNYHFMIKIRKNDKIKELKNKEDEIYK